MSIASVIASNTMLIAILIIFIFLFIQLYLKPKFFPNLFSSQTQTTVPTKQEEMVKDVENAHLEETQKLSDRMKNGFKIMGLKLQNNPYLKNIAEAQKQTDEVDPYSTDFSKVGKVDF